MVQRDLKRLRGLVALGVDATVHGSRAIEKIQMQRSRLPFQILEAIPAVAVPTKVVRTTHDVLVAVTHGSIRAVATGVGLVANVALDAVDGVGTAESKDR